jgi:pullulanase/glycogen debranching enzyme
MKSRTATCLRPVPAQSMAIASTVPTNPTRGSGFLDPYAKQLVGQLRWGPELFGYQLNHADEDLSYDERGSAPLMHKCRVIDPELRGNGRSCTRCTSRVSLSSPAGA